MHSYQVNLSQVISVDSDCDRHYFGLSEDAFVYCCFNNTFKITPGVFDSWARILHEVKNGVLLLYVDNDQAIKNLQQQMVIRGVDPDRLIFGDRLGGSQYWSRYQAVDLFLDTFICSGGATSSDALRAGCPVLTCMGDSASSRFGASILTALELPELITKTSEEYESLAIHLATHPEELKALKQKLVDNTSTALLYDTQRFARSIESAYVEMNDRSQKGMRPDDIYINNTLEAVQTEIISAKEPFAGDVGILVDHYQHGRFDKAETLALSLTQDFPDHQLGWKVLGAIFSQTGRKSEALSAYKEAVRILPTDPEGHSNLGFSLEELGRREDAIASFNRAIELKPDYAQAHYNLGVSLNGLNRLDEAVASFREAIILEPTLVEAHNNLGLILMKLGKLDSAATHFQIALRINPEYTFANNNFGLLLSQLGKFTESVKYYQRALSVNPIFFEEL